MHNTCTTRQVLLVLLCPMLCPLCLVAYACARFGSQWKLYLRYRLSHSNPSLSPAYLRKDARDALRMARAAGLDLTADCDAVRRTREQQRERGSEIRS